MTRLLAALVLLATAGCFQFTTRLQEDPAIKEAVTGEDCAYTLFNLGGGTLDIEVAKRYGQTDRAVKPMSKIRRVELVDTLVLVVLERCVVVFGEP